MTGVWELFRNDLRRATSNVMALIVLCGLVVIPSAFTWFNVIGSWQPFDNTDELKVAVASADTGYTSPLIPLHVNVGDMVESALRANDELDWIITSEEDAVAGTTSGEYYAAMVLPADFSERMLTFYTAGSQRTEIDYYTNDKTNPLAPLITMEGADQLSAKINAEFTKELSNIALSLVSSLATSLGDGQSQAALARVEAHVSDVATQLRGAADTANMFTALIESSIPLVDGASGLLDAAASEFETATGTVSEGLSAVQQAEGSIDQAAQALTAAISASTTRLEGFATDIDEIFTGLDTDVTAGVGLIGDVVDDLGELISDQQALRDRLVDDVAPTIPDEDRPAFDALVDDLDTAIAQEQALQTRLQDTADRIAAGVSDVQGFRTDIDDRITAALAAFADAGTVYANDLEPTLEQLGQALGEVSAALTVISADVATATDAADGIAPVLQTAAADNQQLADTLAAAADEVDQVSDALSTAISTGDLTELGRIIGTDPSALAAAIAQPIGVERIPVYPVVSFGAGMSPLYTVLSLWVGALLLAVTLRVEAPSRAIPEGPALTLTQQFFGRYAIFALLGLAQSTLVMLGNIVLVGLEPVHPLLLMLTGWTTSLVFTFIIYTLIVSFGDAGKALAVFLLVIQVAGAGGAYPLALLPEWFQSISPFLPATHAIDAFRAALAGIYEADYWIAMGWLVAFVLPMLVLGLVLRRPLIGFNHWVERTLQSTKLM
ncbi:YhgE/Pip family protein [Microbacterium koreense]|uniref:YhgE/Pip family protein n=1 Tax=Microbacterium koreense TaxID=323761 RepID=A0ABW2ZR51_9MICO